MNPQNFTQKSQEALQKAQELANQNGQPQVEPPHLFLALLGQEDGVVVQACQACADMYGVSDIHRKLGIEVKYMGKPLSDMIKSDYKILTF